MLLLNRREVESLLDLDRLIEALGPAMAELSAGRVSMPARIMSLVDEPRGLLAAMPVYLGVNAHAFHQAGQCLSRERSAGRAQPPGGDSGVRRGDRFAARPDGWDVHHRGANRGGLRFVRAPSGARGRARLVDYWNRRARRAPTPGPSRGCGRSGKFVWWAATRRRPRVSRRKLPGSRASMPWRARPRRRLLRAPTSFVRQRIRRSRW